MELEALIAQITKEVCLQIQNEGVQRSTLTDMAGYIEFSMLNPHVKLDEIKRMCAVARQKKFAVVCIPQWFVAYAKEQLQGTDVIICTNVGFPGGNTSTAAKYAEVKEAVKNGADEVDIPVNMSMFESGDLESAKKDLEEAMVPAKDRAAVKAVIEFGGLSLEQKVSAVELCKKCGVDFIAISTILEGTSQNIEDIKKAVRICGDDMQIKAIGMITDIGTLNALISAGAQRIGTSKAELLA